MRFSPFLQPFLLYNDILRQNKKVEINSIRIELKGSIHIVTYGDKGLLQIVIVITNCDVWFITKCDDYYYKLR